jgi:hypothetical protein
MLKAPLSFLAFVLSVLFTILQDNTHTYALGEDQALVIAYT